MSTIEKPASSLPSEQKASADDQSSLVAKAKGKILGLGKKKEEDGQTEANPRTMSPPTLLPSPPLTSPSTDRRPSPRGSPRIYPAGVAVSPNRRINRSTSPGLHSPASSQIFERNVQEPEDSSAIPAHIKTEDHIPAALDASSLAITDDHLNPDEVEIVTHQAHQPAAVAVAGSVSESMYHASLSQDDIPLAAGHGDLSESTSNYASLDTTDVRRLSFISFADVVQAEHVENDRDTMQFMSLSSTANRSPSPVRSPTSSHGFSVSPPTSGAASEKGADFFIKGSRAPGSPTTTTTHGAHSPPLGGGGDLQIQTMRQALRKTGSGDLSGARSQPLSAVSLEDSLADYPPFK
ncbi:hypothetical protein K505DRAFT_329057 [Melanomma pulvis-pyrius CBS 109.77]|uniref:Uncharacterized protein n=1 Tax=Melanomma pulvis-pyrius CBS 109.77 TaxID=1314802 RepID=A0A6A6WVX6_9PLEO|nr:hypothetical protein K505DRAFT_329057 [Melanomma pulvis-pyrius CBS 109.77]